MDEQADIGHIRSLLQEIRDRARALEAGAAGYLTKSSAATEMIDAVRTVAQGSAFVSQDLVPGLVVALSVYRLITIRRWSNTS